MIDDRRTETAIDGIRVRGVIEVADPHAALVIDGNTNRIIDRKAVDQREGCGVEHINDIHIVLSDIKLVLHECHPIDAGAIGQGVTAG